MQAWLLKNPANNLLLSTVVSKAKGRDISGVLILDKPAGMSSNYVLQQIKRLYGARKAGHTGALDPLATGVLPICFGEATKFSQFLLDADKRYQTTAQLGVRTDSSDADGTVIATKSSAHITLAEVEAQLPKLRGTISQVPSMFSALKHKGQPLYKLARKGAKVTVPARQVTIYDLTLMAFVDTQVSMDITCSKGTYIRSIVEDLGLALGVGAHVVKLRRLQVGPFMAKHMITPEQLTKTVEDVQRKNEGKIKAELVFAALDALLLPVDTAVLSASAVQLSSRQCVKLQQGRPIQLDQAQINPGIVRVYGTHMPTNKAFLGVADVSADGTLRARRLLQTQVDV